MFICDEYQSFASVGEEDPSGDEKAFALTRQCRVIPIVATQSISSLRSVLGTSEAWRALLQTLRTRIFLSLSDDASADIASKLCGQVARIKPSWTVTESAQQAQVSLLSGRAGGSRGSVGTSKSFREQRKLCFSRESLACSPIARPFACPMTAPTRPVPFGSISSPTTFRSTRPTGGRSQRGRYEQRPRHGLPASVLAGPGSSPRR